MRVEFLDDTDLSDGMRKLIEETQREIRKCFGLPASMVNPRRERCWVDYVEALLRPAPQQGEG